MVIELHIGFPTAPILVEVVIIPSDGATHTRISGEPTGTGRPTRKPSKPRVCTAIAPVIDTAVRAIGMKISEAIGRVTPSSGPKPWPIITGKTTPLSLPVTSSGACVRSSPGRGSRRANTEVVVADGREEPRRMAVARTDEGPALVGLPHAQEEGRTKSR